MNTPFRYRDEWLVKLLVAHADIPAERIEQWRSENRPFLSQLVLDAGILSFEQLAELIRSTFRIASTDLSRTIKSDVAHLVPEKIVRRHFVLPVDADQRHLALAMANPLDENAVQDVRSVTGREVDPLFCSPAALEKATLDELDPDAIVFDLLKNFEQHERVEIVERESEEDVVEVEGEARPPVVQLADNIIANAVRSNASDIHIEHDETSTLVRYRVDGLLKNVLVLPRYVGAGPLVSRIKIMAGLDVSDRLRPQDGRAKLRVGHDVIGLRVSTLPSRTGEKVVLRILNEHAIQARLSELGFHPDVHRRFCALLEKEQGIVLVTGPTGSGKTTTLYAALNHIRDETVNIVTVEDPVEYRLGGITQVQVNEKQGLTFAAVLRSVLRQDPDVVMLGEIRDHETALIAAQAALTGHLVLSTLHTNDTVGAVTRLADIGVEPFKIASSLAGVTAQRLVRKVCSACVHPADPAELPHEIASAMGRLYGKVAHVRGAGCAQCGFTGYKGRLPLIELLDITSELRDSITAAEGDEALRRKATASGALHSIEADALWHVVEGRTTLEQVQSFLEMEELKRETTPVPVAAPAVVDQRNDKRIVVAIGDVVWQAIVGGALAGVDAEITSVANGAEALAEVARRAPDTLLIAADLPIVAGEQVIQGVRNVIKAPTVGIIALMRDEDAALRERLIAAGADEVIAPPFDAASLTARIAAVAKRRTSWSRTADVMKPPTPLREAERIAALKKTGLLDTPPEERFDALTQEAVQKFNVPMAMVSLVDSDRQWFKSKQGLSASETARDVAFCAHAINYDDVFTIEDAYLDPRFSENQLVTGEPHVRFYAGAPIHVDGQKIGMFCVVDNKPRSLTPAEKDELKSMAAIASRRAAEA